MINEILINLLLDKNEELRYLKVAAAHPKLTEALTAIYEIGLECIGADDLVEAGKAWRGEADKEIARAAYRNQLKASQRKAWALKCNIKEGE